MKQLSLTMLVVYFCFSGIAQNVGIGTTTPHAAAKLEVQSNNSGVLIPRLTTAQKTAISSPPAGLKVYDTDKSLFSFYNGGSWMEIKPVNRRDSLWDYNVINNEENIYNNIGRHLYVFGYASKSVGSSGTIDGALTVSHSAQTPLTFVYNLTMDGQGIQARRQNSFIAPQIDAPLLLNKFGGNVGIGLTNPTRARFEVNGVGLGTTSGIFGGDGAGISLQKDWPAIGFNQYFDFNGFTPRYIGNGYAAAIGVNQTNGDFFLDLYSNGSTNNATAGYQNILSVKQSGNVGIGTVNPAHKLSVNGAIQSKEIWVETGWSDYVFEKNYRLRSLAEVEKFIRLHKHLPNIPSAKEIQQGGLPVAEINTKMMEKIEELTLYIIQLEKKFLHQQKQITQLQQQIKK